MRSRLAIGVVAALAVLPAGGTACGARSTETAPPPPRAAIARATSVPLADRAGLRGHARAPATRTKSARADALHRRAAELLAAGRWREAIRSHRRELVLRGAGDSLAFRCLEESANLLYLNGEAAAALGMMESAAAAAVAAGHPGQAATAYLEAALIARDRHDPAGAAVLARHAQRLVADPSIGAFERAAILDRIASRPPPHDSGGRD